MITLAEKRWRDAERAEGIARICEANGDPEAAKFWHAKAEELRVDAVKAEERTWERK
jgi:hypothetical protein